MTVTELSPTDLMTAIEEIAVAARETTLSHFRTGFAVESKEDESPVTIADRATEALIRAAIAERFPGHGILGEEYGSENLDSDYVWVIDPIDGTKSFISGVPLFGTLIGVLYKGAPLAGSVLMPGLAENFVGSPETGSRMNGKPISCRKDAKLSEAFICLNELPKLIVDEPDRTMALIKTGRYPRGTHDCYPYAQLAAGWVDGVVDFDLQPYDYLPVIGVVKGSGAIMTDWNGNELTMESDGRVIAAATPEIHAALLDVLRD